MDIENHLIFAKQKDKTKDIVSCVESNGRWAVKFVNNNQLFHYNKNNIIWYKNPEIKPLNSDIIYHKGVPLNNIQKILLFKEYYRIFYKNGYNQIFPAHELIFQRNCLVDENANKTFAYLKNLANIIQTDENNQENTFLSNQYEHIFAINTKSVMAQYISPSELPPRATESQLFFPFGFNLSQEVATQRALTSKISIIEGPPGTGKTQTILNILANAVMDGKTVAVVSNNNSATKNVFDKLEEYGVGFIAAFLGRQENQETFFENQPPYPDFQGWNIPQNEIKKLEKQLLQQQARIRKMLEAKNEVARIQQELDALMVEKKHFDSCFGELLANFKPYKSLNTKKSKAIMDLWLTFEIRLQENKGFNLWWQLQTFLSRGIFSFSFYKQSPEAIIAYIQKQYFESKINELSANILKLNRKLQAFKLEETLKDYTQKSLSLFKSNLSRKYVLNEQRPVFPDSAVWDNNFSRFIHEYPVILSTTHSLRKSAPQNFLFDYVIMDEASQVDIISGALALSCAKNAVIVGDKMQLPHVVPNDLKKITNGVFGDFSINLAYNYSENSMLSSMAKLFNSAPRTLLREHYRCHPKIIGFCNTKFYSNELIILTEAGVRKNPLQLYQITEGNHSRDRFSQREIDVIKHEIIPSQNLTNQEKSLGIISPFRNQVNMLAQEIAESGVQIDTVHKYQGRERKIIILTTVVDNANRFVNDANLINVAVSRAVDKIILVASPQGIKKNSHINDLRSYIQYQNGGIVQSQVFSVFDLLYSTYSKHLLSYLDKKKNVSEYESENLMHVVIEKVLSRQEFNNFDSVIHYSLKLLLRDLGKLDSDEYSFATNPNTHVDFLIFRKLDKTPILAVEVDGYAFHAIKPEQLERDNKKDRILEKYDIPIIRFSTVGSNEEDRLHKKLSEILGN